MKSKSNLDALKKWGLVKLCDSLGWERSSLNWERPDCHVYYSPKKVGLIWSGARSRRNHLAKQRLPNHPQEKKVKIEAEIISLSTSQLMNPSGKWWKDFRTKYGEGMDSPLDRARRGKGVRNFGKRPL